jgi:RHS repeat-associated protein
MTYDDTGRLLTVVDPEQGTLSYTYDQDNHILTAVQTSGSNSRTTGYNYDLLGRLICEQAGAAGVISWNGACSGGSALFQNTYDTTKLGVQGTSDYPVGQLTQSVATTYYPDGTSATVTEQFQHDQRARLTNEQIQLGLPSGWNVSAGLPVYQEAMSYNDANQVTTTSTTEGSAGYSFTSVYDPTNGVQQGLSNSSLSTANLATLSYNEYAELSGITLLNGASSSPTSVATEQYGYDADQRPITLSASWLPGSGNSGQIVGQSRNYDHVGNVTSLATTFAPIPGQTGSGGAQTENFCYDEQNRLVWAGNSGTQPGAGTGTCGSGTLANSLSGAGYSAPYAYTNLGQIWQGPLNHQGAQQQYLYCTSNAPHQLTGIYPLGTTCSTMSSATPVYSASYDPWGNQTTRTTGGVTGTLSYDQSNRMTEWNAGAASQEFYLYDATGNRILKRSITGTGTTLAVYSFGLEENDYTGTGVLTTQTHYYNLAGHLIGSTTGATTTFYMTDGLDSVLTAFGQSAIEGEQVYGPFGASSYQSGLINTAKGYTGQVHDGVSGLDYYVARYYDPVMGMFLSVDTVQGNQQGMDPYQYVGDNPETHNDPSGHCWPWCTALIGAVVGAVVGSVVSIVQQSSSGKPINWGNVAGAAAIGAAVGAAIGIAGPLAAAAIGAGSVTAAAATVGTAVLSVGLTTVAESGIAAFTLASSVAVVAASVASNASSIAANPAGCGLSFRSDTPVATSHGEQAIGTLKVGEKVWAYNPQTKKMELEPIQRIWLNHDNDLVDLTLTITIKDTHGKASQQKEVLHTNERHPFLTKEKGFIPVSQLKPGMHVLTANGHYGVVAKLVTVPGAMWMYNLTVTQDHTYAVGSGQWIVHNCTGANNDNLGNVNGFDGTLAVHARNHSNEPGINATSKANYNQQAVNFMSGAPKDGEQQIWNPVTGQYYRWDPNTGVFGIYSADQKRVVSFFNIGTGKDAESYFAKQYWAIGRSDDGTSTEYASDMPANPTLEDVIEAQNAAEAENADMLRLMGGDDE